MDVEAVKKMNDVQPDAESQHDPVDYQYYATSPRDVGRERYEKYERKTPVGNGKKGDPQQPQFVISQVFG